MIFIAIFSPNREPVHRLEGLIHGGEHSEKGDKL